MKNRPIIWHLLSNRWNSAITEYAINCAKATEPLASRLIFSPLFQSPAHNRINDEAIECMPFESFGFKGLLRFWACFRIINPDVLFVYGGPETFLAQLICPTSCRIFRFRGDARDQHFKSHSFSQLNFYHISGLFFPSELAAAPFSRVEISKAVIPLGCDSSKYYVREPIGRPFSKIELLYVGRFDPIKGIDRLLKFYRALKERWPIDSPHLLLKIIGYPANISTMALVEMVRSQELGNDDVAITDAKVPNIEEQMNQATAGIIPSLGSEIICRVAEEFLLCGTPILVSDAGSLPESVFEGAGLVLGKPDHWLDRVDASIKFLLKAGKESKEEKIKRSFEASKRFSLETMSDSLNRLLEPEQ